MVPLLYLIYSQTSTTLSAQTVVAHATSLGVAFVTSLVGTWRYAKQRAIAWRPALIYGIPGTVSAFLTARALTQAKDTEWVRGAFGCFLIVTGLDMVRRALNAGERQQPRALAGRREWTVGIAGLGSGILASLLGIGGGLLGVPVMLYLAQLPIKAIAPTTLAAVSITTLFGVLGYLTAPTAPPVSETMVGFIDVRMAVPLMLGAACTVPLGVRINRAAQSHTLHWIFAVLLLTIGGRLTWQGFFE